MLPDDFSELVGEYLLSVGGRHTQLRILPTAIVGTFNQARIQDFNQGDARYTKMEIF